MQIESGGFVVAACAPFAQQPEDDEDAGRTIQQEVHVVHGLVYSYGF